MYKLNAVDLLNWYSMLREAVLYPTITGTFTKLNTHFITCI